MVESVPGTFRSHLQVNPATLRTDRRCPRCSRRLGQVPVQEKLKFNNSAIRLMAFTLRYLRLLDDLDQLLAEHPYDHVQVPLVLLLVVDELFDDLLIAETSTRRWRQRARCHRARVVTLVEHVHEHLRAKENETWLQKEVDFDVLLVITARITRCLFFW